MRNIRILAAFTILAGGATAVGVGCSSVNNDDNANAASVDLVTSPDLVIRQVYGGGGNTGAPFTNDFVELFNRGSAAVSLGGKSVQYASSTGTFSATANVLSLPSVMVPPGGSYLIQLSGGAVGVALTAPDLVAMDAGALALAATNGKIALVSSAALLDACGSTAVPCSASAWIDLVGYGSASQAEGTAAGALTNTTAAIRKNNGCQDTGDNSADFDTASGPTPHNSGSAAVTCPAIDAGSSSGGSSDASSDADATTVHEGGGGSGDGGGNGDGGGIHDASTTNDATTSKDGSTVKDSGDPEEDDASTSSSSSTSSSGSTSSSSGTTSTSSSGGSGTSGSTKKPPASSSTSSGVTVTPEGGGSPDSGCSTAPGSSSPTSGGMFTALVGMIGFFGIRRRRR